jgi:transposase
MFIDESGFMLTPSVRRTWSPVGHTPLLRHQFRNDRLSVISGLSVSPSRQRLGLYGMFFWDNIGHEEVCLFLHQVLRHLRGNVIALLDNSNTHRGRPLVQLCQSFPRLRLEYFPPYAPELNPDEGVWGLLKGKLANGRPDDIDELADDLQTEFRAIAGSQRQLRGCIHQSELPFHMR